MATAAYRRQDATVVSLIITMLFQSVIRQFDCPHFGGQALGRPGPKLYATA